jgi:quinohemoprotein ethanol dehydrogenase
MSSHRHTPCAAWLVVVLGIGAANGSLHPAAAQQKPRDTAEFESVGWDLYLSNCARCHGGKAETPGPAGNLRGLLATHVLDSASFVSVVKEGRADAGMPPFKDMLNDRQIAAIYAYLRAFAENRLQ